MKRTMRGVPLLISAAGAIVTIGCGGGGGGSAEEPVRPPVGNLMPPPTVTVCVTVDPPEATVTINGQAVDAQGCATVVDQGSTVIEADAEGYQVIAVEVPNDQLEPTYDLRLEPDWVE